MYGGIEMKKITFVLLSMLLITPCTANIHIYSETVKTVVKQKFTTPDAQVAAVAEYNAQVKKANNAGIPASGIWSVCKAGGWDITKPDGESKCRDFGNTLLKYATWKFKEVCGKDDFMVKKGTGECVGDVFSNKVLGGIKVNMLVAPGLAKEYARVKFADKDLVCNPKYRSTTIPPDDYVQCLSMNKNMAYEFRFDSVTATMDNVITEGTELGICKIYDVKYSPLGVTLDTAYSKGESWPAACETTDAAKCSKINETMQKFGRTAKIGTTGSTGNKHSACVIKKDTISASSLRTAFGIDNYVFKKGGVQLNATTAVKDQVCAYVRQAVKSPAITSCDCNDGFTQLYDFSGMITETDDVLTCKINGKNVDFVFDDLSERNRKIATGGSQGMDCMAAGGTYAGQQCMYLDEKQCKMLAKANLQNCPTCKKVEYKNGVCQLPSGADAIQTQKNQRIALIVGGAVVGVVVTVATAGTTGAPVTAVVFTLVETTGAVMEYNAQVKIDGIADEFLLTSQKCKSASCAEKLVKQNLQRLSNVAGDMPAAERNAVDHELARLVGLLPDDSQFLIDIIGGESLTGANQKSLFDADSWEPEQVWRAVGITLQMTSIFASVGKWVLKSTGILAKDLPEATIKITSKAKMSRVEIQKALSQGKVVKTSNGMEIPKGKLAAEVATNEGRLTGITGKTKYEVVNMLDDWMIQNGSSVIVQYDKNMKAIYTAGIQDRAMPTIEQWLRTNRVPYSKNGNYIQILETDLERVGGFVRNADDPIITKIVNALDDDAYNRAIDNTNSLDDMQQAAEDIMRQREYVNIVFKDAIDPQALQSYASSAKQQYLHIIATDEDLALDALRFDELSTAQKQKFANKIIRKYNAGVCDGGTCQMNANITAELRRAQAYGDQRNGIIRLSEDRAATGLDDFMETLSHENNHFHDEHAAGFLNYEQARLGSNTAGKFTTDDDIYYMNLTEHASDVIGRTVGANFTSDLRSLIKRLYRL